MFNRCCLSRLPPPEQRRRRCGSRRVGGRSGGGGGTAADVAARREMRRPPPSHVRFARRLLRRLREELSGQEDAFWGRYQVLLPGELPTHPGNDQRDGQSELFKKGQRPFVLPCMQRCYYRRGKSLPIDSLFFSQLPVLH